MDSKGALQVRTGMILAMVALSCLSETRAEDCRETRPRRKAPDLFLDIRERSSSSPLDRTAEPLPTTEDLLATAESVRTGEWKDLDAPPSVLRTTMLDLIERGHPELAWAFLMRAWPVEHPGRTAFLWEFLEELAESPTWLQVGE